MCKHTCHQQLVNALEKMKGDVPSHRRHLRTKDAPLGVWPPPISTRLQQPVFQKLLDLSRDATRSRVYCPLALLEVKFSRDRFLLPLLQAPFSHTSLFPNFDGQEIRLVWYASPYNDNVEILTDSILAHQHDIARLLHDQGIPFRYYIHLRLHMTKEDEHISLLYPPHRDTSSMFRKLCLP